MGRRESITGGKKMPAYYGRPGYCGGGSVSGPCYSEVAKYDKLERKLEKKHEAERALMAAKLRDLKEKLTPEGYARYVEKHWHPRLKAQNMERKRLDSRRRAALHGDYASLQP